jgi:photosystem II stability/assembly factor-like uncharacterized protein
MKKHLLLFILLISITTLHAQWFIQNGGVNIGQIRDSYFINENIGWLLVDGNKTYYTHDGGDTWNCIDTLSCFIDKIYFVDTLNGWGTGDTRIINTQDGGNSWTIQYENTDTVFFQQYRDVFFTDLNHGWVVGYDTVLITANGGNFWQPVKTDLWLPWSVFFLDQNIGWIAGDDGKIIKTTDGGNTWMDKPTSSSGEFQDITFTDQNNGWIAGTEWISGWQSIVLRTTDGGDNWNYTLLPGAQTLYSVSFSDSLNGWMCGSYGTLWHTQNGGNTWELQTTPTSNYLFTINFVNQNTGWATGLYGTIIKTNNGGIVGLDQNIFTSINDIEVFPNPSSCLIHFETTEKLIRIELYNMTGENIWNEKFHSENTINISSLVKGVYLIKLFSEKNVWIEKIIKE